jgi:Mg2+ and Co2+ transporter CorA
VSARWLDLVDPTRDELLATLPVPVDPEVVEVLAEPPGEGREARPFVEGHGAYVFGVLVAPRPVPDEDRTAYQEVDVVATPGVLVTVRKTPGDGGPPFDVSALHPAAEQSASAGVLIHRLIDEVADSFLDSVDASYAEIEELEDALETWPSSRVRMRLSDLRHELLHARRTVAATRAAVRRILDGRIELGEHALFPAEVERLFADTYETLVRVTEELDIARDLLAGVRDHHQSKVTEGQGEVAKKLTVIASLVLVPSLIVGYYGQNFESAFDEAYWSISVSTGLIVVSSLIQLAIFRWRRWI